MENLSYYKYLPNWWKDLKEKDKSEWPNNHIYDSIMRGKNPRCGLPIEECDIGLHHAHV